MWIRTQGGFLLNMDRMDYVLYTEDMDMTIAYAADKPHAVSHGNILETIIGAIRCNVTILEVR